MKALDDGNCPTFKFNEKRLEDPPRLMEPNREGFQRYLLQGNQKTLYERQFNLTFGEIGPQRVNCWVKVENIEGDLKSCLWKYFRWSGSRPDWAVLDEAFPSNRGVHGTCEAYYSPAEERSFLYDNRFL